MKVIIIGAMEKEINYFYDKISFRREDFVLKGNFNSHEVYLIKCGIGKVNAACQLQYLLDQYDIDLIINTGCCGALDENLKLMDVVLASSCIYHDFYPERILNEAVGALEVDKELLEEIENTLKDMNISYKAGVIASGDHFVTDEKIKTEIKERTGAIAVDMESAAIAQVAKINQIPYIILRTVSDKADGMDDFEKEASKKSGEIVLKILETEKIINNE